MLEKIMSILDEIDKKRQEIECPTGDKLIEIDGVKLDASQSSQSAARIAATAILYKPFARPEFVFKLRKSLP